MRITKLLTAGFALLGTISALQVKAEKDETLTVHIVPHSYDAPLFRFIDDFYPWA
jgi:hypothetical protein